MDQIMKSSIKRIIKAHLICAVACLTLSCQRLEPENPTNPDNTVAVDYTSEHLLLVAYKAGYKVWSFKTTDDSYVFNFREHPVISAVAEEYPDGIPSIILPKGIVKSLSDNITSIDIFFLDGQSVLFERVIELVTDLALADTVAFAGSVLTFPFRILSSNGPTLEASVTAEGAQASVTLDADLKGGVLEVIPQERNSRTNITLSNGMTAVSVDFAADIYYLSVAGFPDESVENFGDGDEYGFSFDIDTNLPDENIVIDADDWIDITFGSGLAQVSLAANLSAKERTGTVVVREMNDRLPDKSFTVRQDWLLYTPQGDYVTFSDKAFKAACLETADIDGDRQVSFAEAAAVKELYLPGKGITDLTGLEMFMNLEFFEAQDNNIRNADMLAELHFLHWLDLKGNRNLESFDVSGCSVYFERCWYEVTPQLRYKTFLRQLNITYDCDMYCAHGDVDFDHRVSTDYSRQGELVQWHEHTVGDGKKVLVFTGLGYLDVDHQDGSFDRVMKDALKLYLEACPKLEEHFEEFDVYMMRHIMRTRDEYVFPGAMWNTDEIKPIMKAYNQERTHILKESYNKVSLSGENKLVLTFSIDIHPNVCVVPAVGTTFVLDNWSNDYNNEYQMLEQINPVPTLDIDKLNEYGFRNRRLETVTVDIVKSGGTFPNCIYNFFGIQ